jgi:hypothetical protein
MSIKLSVRSRSTRNPVFMEPLEQRQLLALVGGIDPYNMGKGDWIWQISAAMTNTGTTTVQGLVNFLKAKGLKWVVVKAGEGNTGPGTGLYAQFNKDLVDRFRTAGIKIFGYHFVYGGMVNSKGTVTTQAGEKTVSQSIMALNPDGLLIDAEGDWERNPNASALAEDYSKNFKTRFPDKLLGYAPFAYPSLHRPFPYLAYSKWCDVVMPQMYWTTISRAGSPEKMVADVDAEWKVLYNSFAASGNASAIRPIVPIGQGYDVSSTKVVPGAEITRFFNLLRNDTDPASPFGYNGTGFWSVQHHSGDVWQAIQVGTLNAGTGSIAGMVYNDVDGDGVRDQGEAGIAGRFVWDDTDNDGVRDGYEPFSKTDAQGNYLIPYRPGGSHRIRQEVPGGWRQTSPNNNLSNTVSLSTGQKAVARDFGVSQTSKIVGTLYNDANADGIKQVGEKALAGWTVYADVDKDGVLDANEARGISDGAGNYLITVSAGVYQLREVLGSGFRVTSPRSTYYDVTLGSGQSTTKLFGNTMLTLISGYVFHDKDGDGLKEAGETPLSGWRVFVDSDGDGLWDSNETNVLTDSTGKYRFGTLAAGVYRIQVFQNQGWTPTIPGSGARKITMVSGGTTSNKNFGERPIA